MNILIIEDEIGIANFLRDGLAEEGFAIDIATTGPLGLDMAVAQRYDLLLVDWMLPGFSGIELCQKLRKKDVSVPIIMLTARDTTDDLVFGLESGANDYVRKPFAFDELLARIRVQLRPKSGETTEITLGDISMNLVAHQVSRAGQIIELTSREFSLLEFLIRNKGRACSRTRIIEQVWDIHFEIDTSVIDVYIAYLRKKLNSSDRPDYIHTVRGVGYMAKEP